MPITTRFPNQGINKISASNGSNYIYPYVTRDLPLIPGCPLPLIASGGNSFTIQYKELCAGKSESVAVAAQRFKRNQDVPGIDFSLPLMYDIVAAATFADIVTLLTAAGYVQSSGQDFKLTGGVLGAFQTVYTVSIGDRYTVRDACGAPIGVGTSASITIQLYDAVTCQAVFGGAYSIKAAFHESVGTFTSAQLKRDALTTLQFDANITAAINATANGLVTLNGPVVNTDYVLVP